MLFGFSSLFLSVWLSFLSPLILFVHPGVPGITFPSPFCHPLPDLVGFRPYGLEEDVRQYEQDLAKRLYQARVRASQCTPEAPLPPTSSSDSQLRSEGQTHGIVGVCWGALALGYFLLEINSRKVQASTCRRNLTVLPQPFLCRLAFARLCWF